MNLPERRDAALRRLLEEAGAPSVPPGLTEAAVRRGARLERRRRAVRVTLWTLFCAAFVASVVLLLVTGGPTVPPSKTTPPLQHW
ncbi:hypothetical protein [Streptomyces tsukubensis]|uniref:DUF3040 domain-containing protein n=1 Tax=Streptomyces tsukubensis TaxID=83656 RepID=A0A1V4AC19_9ACTN|nr:hypothetical protein [Streptomyces tsukubensis]OON81438.1 hypothetical protein B1H18_08990 [Streptomyces tsukubensis]QFR95433.1 hypothetical protein GBW32_23440 [Streptomyces tsukubensis]